MGRIFSSTVFGVAVSVAGLASFAGPLHAATNTPAVPGPVARPAASKGEPAITTPGANGDYLRAVHTRLHGRWTDDFVKVVSATHPADHPLNTPSRQVTLALTIRWDGTIAERIVKQSSGVAEFDRAAMDIVRKSAPFALPPVDVVSDDSFAHLEWTFSRDQRGCAAGAKVVRVDDPLDVSLPRLLANNRVGEALRRVSEAGAAGSDANVAGLDRFARLYLARTVPDPVLNAAGAFALAQAGDQSQAPRLRAALASRSTVEISALGLRKLNIDVCDVEKDAMENGAPQVRAIALDAVRAVGTAGADILACRPALAAMVADSRQTTALRLKALDTLVTFVPAASARPVVLAASEDKDPVVRGAALLASVRKGAGRPEMYRLAPLLHDKVVEVRGAASAGMVRAGGDMALDQLYLLGRETDARPGTWVAAELAQMSTRPSAEFLGRMMKKSNLPVQVAAARALAARKDPAARSELDAVKGDEHLPHEVREIATGDSKAAVAGSPHGDDPAKATAAADPLRQLLKSNRAPEGATWIIDHFQSLEAPAGIDVLGTWLSRQNIAAAETPATPSPAQPPTATNVPHP